VMVMMIADCGRGAARGPSFIVVIIIVSIIMSSSLSA
jgi:hypothetical protein